MPSLNFKKRFAGMVEEGLKPEKERTGRIKGQTIRAFRKDCRNPRIGDTLYLFTGMRTKSCRRLGQTVCKSVKQITVDQYGINVAGRWLGPIARDNLAVADGFSCFTEMREFFEKEHGLPFDGLLYKW